MAKKSAKKSGAWTKEEEKALRKAYSSATNKEIAAQLGRTEKAVEHKAANLGLKKSKTYMKKLRAGKKK